MTRGIFKIAVTGSHSTGKTTFLERLRPALDDLGLRTSHVHDSAVDARDLGFPILAGHTFESTAWLIAQAIRLETTAALSSDVILVDRPVPDALGYLLAALRHTGRTMDADKYGRLDKLCTAWAGEYDLVFLTRLDPTIVLGPGRDGNAAFRLDAAAAVTEVVDRIVPGRHMLTTDGAGAAVSLAVGRVLEWAKCR